MLRLIFYGFLFYFLYKIFGNLSGKLFSSEKPEVKGEKNKKDDIDLSKFDVEDADFEDIK